MAEVKRVSHCWLSILLISHSGKTIRKAAHAPHIVPPMVNTSHAEIPLIWSRLM